MWCWCSVPGGIKQIWPSGSLQTHRTQRHQIDDIMGVIRVLPGRHPRGASVAIVTDEEWWQCKSSAPVFYCWNLPLRGLEPQALQAGLLLEAGMASILGRQERGESVAAGAKPQAQEQALALQPHGGESTWSEESSPGGRWN